MSTRMDSVSVLQAVRVSPHVECSVFKISKSSRIFSWFSSSSKTLFSSSLLTWCIDSVSDL
ncbi:hypothetical protein HanXRQr2_Chr02g0066341 [Helianthus annuus]|uniref:Uncharacterized protein n=1 Tax=Helianthus annuus TaxID=4232 RepID=A0A9K3NYZ6_HELAN|nr:hypothetical protein HanXRQr2_Chr02g0066341 [Helianthus annuus]KAJ0951850.1 hypothetical protein HanPSC8_Chr02g0065231 [Helianthus annuus]